MKIRPPAWWKPWYKLQVMHAAALALNLGIILLSPSVFSALSWIAIGACGAFLLSNRTTFRVLDDNRTLSRIIQEQSDMMTAILETRMDELGKHIGATVAEHIDGAELGGEHRITKH